MKKHPDYLQELDRLTFTKAYMDSVIAAQETDQETLQKTLSETVETLDFKDSSLRYQNMLTHANFMKMSKEQLENLKKLRRKPYFARINFHRKEKPENEIFYIGKVSLFDRETQMPIILDWRSPLANVYYEGRLGEVSYEAHGETYEGEVSLKRQYQIEEGELHDFQDIDITTKDELLQTSLSQNADNRLTEIVSTIQEEQNRVIRDDLRKPIIVQGAAGSGKTTIALHRISYFLYSLRDIFKPEEMLILAPNRIFIDYISEVLPELGVEKANQTTYQDFVKQVTGHKWKVISQHQTLTSIIENKTAQSSLQLWLAEYKGSKAYKEMLDRYLVTIKKSFLITKDFKVADFRLMNGKKMKKLFLVDYAYLPFYKRKEKIRRVLTGDLKRKKKLMIEKVKKLYEKELDKALYDIKDAEKRQKRVSFLVDQRDEKIKIIEEEAKIAVREYMKQYPNEKLISHYQALFLDERLFAEHCDPSLSDQQKQYLKEHTMKLFMKKQCDAEDLAGLLYMQSYLYGLDPDYQAKKVVIDEAQDYSYMEFCSLKKALNTELFTIVGDLAQGIYRYRGLKSWDALLQGFFKEANYRTLQKTYRTTVEIMEVANEILLMMDESLPLAEPVVRHGDKPKFVPTNDNWIEKLQVNIETLQQQKFKSFAIIGKTQKECKKIYHTLRDKLSLDMDMVVLTEQEEMVKDKLIILPAYLAKGLEFDAVFLINMDEQYEKTELDLKLLYVAMTRSLHRLLLFSKEKEDFLLNEVEKSKFMI